MVVYYSMDLGKKALYTTLRLKFQENPRLAVEKWQVEDLSLLSLPALSDRLKELGRSDLAEKAAFIAIADSFESPEEMAEALGEELDAKEADQLYLLIFELWRRFLSERKTITLFADDLDRQIALYDAGKIEDFSHFQDTLQNLLMLFQDSDESALTHREFMTRFSKLLAHDLESFFYDFLSEEIEAGHSAYVLDFLETLSPFVTDQRWFDLLFLEASPPSEGEEFQKSISELIKKQKKPDLDFFLELADFLSRRGDRITFGLIAKKIIPLLQNDDDLLDFLELALDFFRLSDDEEKESYIQNLLASRPSLKTLDQRKLQTLFSS